MYMQYATQNVCATRNMKRIAQYVIWKPHQTYDVKSSKVIAIANSQTKLHRKLTYKRHDSYTTYKRHDSYYIFENLYRQSHWLQWRYRPSFWLSFSRGGPIDVWCWRCGNRLHLPFPVFIHVFTYVCTRMYTYMWVHVYSSARVCSWIYIRIYIRMSLQKRSVTSPVYKYRLSGSRLHLLFLYTYMQKYVHTRICIFVTTCLFLYTYTYKDILVNLSYIQTHCSTFLVYISRRW
jgi:hypothetical protein